MRYEGLLAGNCVGEDINDHPKHYHRPDMTYKINLHPSNIKQTDRETRKPSSIYKLSSETHLSDLNVFV